MAYQYLPGTYMSVNDGGLAAKPNFTTKRTVILGTSASGPADVQYQVVDRAVAAQAFGLQGTLIQAMEEVAQGGCDNILLFRIGAKSASLQHIGTELVDSGAKDGQNHIIYVPVDQNNLGFEITFGAITPTVSNDYQVYYSGATPTNDSAGILEIYYKGNIVYSNDPNAAVDTQDCTVTGMAVGGKAIINSSASVNGSRFDKSLPLSNSLIAASTVTNIAASDGPPAVLAHQEPALLLNLGDTGLSLTPGSVNFDPCALYEAQDTAFRLLELSPVDQVYVANATFDCPNVAFLASGALTNDVNNPVNGKALGWLKTSLQDTGDVVYTWAHKVTNSASATVTPPTFASAKDRISQGFHEVSFGYQVARFAATQSQNEGGCVAFIGTSAPKSYRPNDLKTWYGGLPTYDVNGHPSVSGSGLLGNPYLTGTVSSKLNTLCADIATKAYRVPGFFQTTNVEEPARFGEYDGGSIIDDNGYPVDLGKYLVLTCSWALLRNGYQTIYANNISGVVAGYTSALDEKLALTNKAMPGVSQIYRTGAATLDALTQAKINELKFKGDQLPPVLTHDRTCASLTSDYTFLLRLRILFLVTDMLFTSGDNFVGRSSTDSLTISALDTDLDKKFQALLKGNYISGYSKNVYTTKSDKAAGRFFITASFVPADQAVQLICKVSAGS